MPTGKVRIKETEQGGALYQVTDGVSDYYAITVEQPEVRIINGKLKSITRIAEIMGSPQDMIRRNFQPGEEMRGHIVAKQQKEPIYEDDPEAFILTDRNGVIIRHENSVIWELNYYSEAANDIDEFII